MRHFKSLLLLLAATVLTTAVQAQVINGDLNHNQGLDVEDVTLLIDGYLTGEAETLITTVDPYMVDNSRVAGTWSLKGGESFTFNADGTFGGNLEGKGYTYKFMPFQGRILEYDSSGKFVNEIIVLEVTEETLFVKLKDGNYYTYTHPQPEKVYEAVDLGLSVKWATMNIGANAPEEYGDHFAWGETTPKSAYIWSTYTLCKGSETTLTKYCTSSDLGTVDDKTVLDPEDDAAHVNWGGTWRMPTYDELDELKTKCTWVWTVQNGVSGRKVTGPNGNSIFLPASGYRYDSWLDYAGSYGYYWSSSLYTSSPNYAWYVSFNSSYFNWYNGYRYFGRSVRAVCP